MAENGPEEAVTSEPEEGGEGDGASARRAKEHYGAFSYEDNSDNDSNVSEDGYQTARNQNYPGMGAVARHGYFEPAEGRAPRKRREEPKRLPNLKVDSFDGSQDWEDFLASFELKADLGHWAREDKRRILACSLKGSALTYYSTLPRKDKGSFCSLVSSLSKRYGTVTDQQREHYEHQLERRQRKPNEAPEALADALR